MATERQWNALVVATEKRLAAKYPRFAYVQSEVNGHTIRHYFPDAASRDEGNPDDCIAQIECD